MTAHQVHGLGTGLEAPAWPAITPDEADRVLARFPEAGRLERLDWHSPRPFSAATLARTDRDDVLVKRHAYAVRTPEGLAEEHRFIDHLRRAGLPVATMLRTEGGDGSLVLDGWTYEVHRRTPGLDLYRDRQSWTPFLSATHARSAGAALARLHRAAEGHEAPARAVRPLVSTFSILPATDPVAAAQAYVLHRPALAAYVANRPWPRDLAALFRALGAGLPERLAALPPLWTHGDWHASNLLWDEAGAVATVLDFGLADRTTALYDLALAVERNAIAWLRIGEQGIADAAMARELLAGYASVTPLSAADRDLIGRLLPLVHVEFALSEVDYFHGILADAVSASLAWDGYLIGHAEWFMGAEGRAFLTELARGD